MVVLASLTSKEFFHPVITSKNPKNLIKLSKTQLAKMLEMDRQKLLNECPIDYPDKSIKKTN